MLVVVHDHSLISKRVQPRELEGLNGYDGSVIVEELAEVFQGYRGAFGIVLEETNGRVLQLNGHLDVGRLPRFRDGRVTYTRKPIL